MSKGTQTIEMTVDDYICLLDERRANVEEWWKWTIPDGVYNWFIQSLEDGCGIDPEHASPKYVIDNMAVNGDYTVIENCSDFDKVFSLAVEKLGDANSPENGDDAAEVLNAYIQDNLDELLNEAEVSYFFTYDDEDSTLGKGICYSL